MPHIVVVVLLRVMEEMQVMVVWEVPAVHPEVFLEVWLQLDELDELDESVVRPMSEGLYE